VVLVSQVFGLPAALAVALLRAAWLVAVYHGLAAGRIGIVVPTTGG
jgi:hypothetical protein